MDVGIISNIGFHAIARQNQMADALIVNEGNADSIVNEWIQIGFDLGNRQWEIRGKTLAWVTNTRHILAHVLAIAESVTECKTIVC